MPVDKSTEVARSPVLSGEETEFPLVMRGYERESVDDARRDLRRELLQLGNVVGTHAPPSQARSRASISRAGAALSYQDKAASVVSTTSTGRGSST